MLTVFFFTIGLTTSTRPCSLPCRVLKTCMMPHPTKWSHRLNLRYLTPMGVATKCGGYQNEIWGVGVPACTMYAWSEGSVSLNDANHDNRNQQNNFANTVVFTERTGLLAQIQTAIRVSTEQVTLQFLLKIFSQWQSFIERYILQAYREVRGVNNKKSDLLTHAVFAADRNNLINELVFVSLATKPCCGDCMTMRSEWGWRNLQSTSNKFSATTAAT